MAAAGSSSKLLLLFLCVAIYSGLGEEAYAQNSSSCLTSYTFNNSNKLFSDCDALTVQGASIAWNFDTQNRTLEVLFSGVAPASGGWVGWGINTDDTLAMGGTQAFIAFAASNGSTILTYNVTDATKAGTPLKCTPISLHVLDMQVEIAGTSILMLVSIQLQPNQSTSLYHVWNRGSSVSNFVPAMHALTATDLSGLKIINMASANSSTNTSTNSSSGGTIQTSDQPQQNASSSCSTSYTINNSNKLFSMCNTLTVQGANLAWNFDAQNRTLEVLFSGVAPASGGWVGWGINTDDKLAMGGTQAFIAFSASNGSTILTYNVTDGTKSGDPLKCTPISLHVLDMQVEIVDTSILMLVSIQLQPNQSTSLYHVWNRGSSVSDFIPGIHALTATDLSGLKVIDMASGSSSEGTIQLPHQILKNRHGVLNTVGWGILLPCGVLAARYLRFFDPAWFYIHVSIQMAGFILGVAGWATGIRLGNYSVGVMYRKHRYIGIALFAIATLQVTALLLRPKKDHKIRKAWNLYHYTLGAAILVLGILNIFYGFDILSPPKKWRRAYIGVLIFLAALTVCLELLRWIYTYMRREPQDKIQGAHVGGVHSLGNGLRQNI